MNYLCTVTLTEGGELTDVIVASTVIEAYRDFIRQLEAAKISFNISTLLINPLFDN